MTDPAYPASLLKLEPTSRWLSWDFASISPRTILKCKQDQIHRVFKCHHKFVIRIGHCDWLIILDLSNKEGMTSRGAHYVTVPGSFSQWRCALTRNHNFLHHSFGYTHCVNGVNRFVSAQTDNPFNPTFIAAETTFWVVILVLNASIDKTRKKALVSMLLHEICSWRAVPSYRCVVSYITNENLSFGWLLWRKSSCFCSSRLKILISDNSLLMKRSSTVRPKEPVPPVINRILLSYIVLS